MKKPFKKYTEDSVEDRINWLWEKTDFTSTLFKHLTGYAIIAADFDGNILAYNEGARLMYGYEPDEIIGKHKIEVFFPEDFVESGEFQHIISELINKGSYSCEVENIKNNGDLFPAQILFTLTKDNLGKVVGFIKIVEDLTRKRAEEDLRKRHSELSVLYDISSAISRTIDINELLSVVLNTITGFEILNIDRKGGIFIIEGNKMNLIFHLGHSDDFLNLHKDMKVGSCLCGLAAKSGKIITSKNCDKDSSHTIRYPEMTPHGHIIIPLKVFNKSIGVLYLYLPADIEIDESKVRLLLSIGNQIGIAINNAKLYEETRALSLHDPLTGLANRRLMDIIFERSFARAKRFGAPFSVIMLDIDYFKKYNDTYGHPAGDKSLVELAKILKGEVREIDLVVRYGGEEFLILLPETKLPEAYEVAERIRKTVEAETGITISLGVSSYQQEMQKKEDLINKSDEALYLAKQKGRNRVEKV